jgi:hypothetical protein
LDDPLTPPQFDEYAGYYTILKGRFRAVETNTYGQFMIYLNERDQRVENVVAIASHYSTAFDFDPHLPWHEFEEDIINKKWKGEFATGLSQQLQSYLENALEYDRGNELYHLVKNLEQMKIESLLQAILMKPLADKNILIETDSEFLTKEAMNATRDARDARRAGVSAGQEGFSKSAGPSNSAKAAGASPGRADAVKDVVDVDLVLAPVSGTSLTDLREGDIVMVRINDKTAKGSYYVDLLGTRENGEVAPSPAEVLEISRDRDGAYVILCGIDEGVVGKAIEAEPVKVKKYDEFLASTQMLENVRTGYPPDGNRNFILFVSITGGLLFVLLLLFILFWFYNFF